MPRTKYTNHKGRNRRFTNPEELEQERKRDQKKSWRAKNPNETVISESEDEESVSEHSGLSEDSDDSSKSDDPNNKSKGVEGLIAIENPNRVQKKVKKVIAISEDDNPQLSRREREELEKQRAALHYQKLHAEGKTEEARSDLARLAIIKQQREEAARKREMQNKEKEIAKQTKTAQVHKAIGKQ